MEKDFKRMLQLWGEEHPSNLEIHELFELCSKYPNIDLVTNIPDYFYDKELCDAIRDIAKYSTTTIEDAELYMRYSNDYERDGFIVKKLANVGMSNNNILPIIRALNGS